jgi:hypothetical protein
MSSKEKKSKKSSKSSKHETKHHSSSKLAEVAKVVLAKVVSKPKHYTTRHLASAASSVGSKYGSSIVRAAIETLKGKESITFSRKEGGKGKKGAYVIVPLSKKAA